MDMTYFKQKVLPEYSKHLGKMNENVKLTIGNNEFESLSDYEFAIRFGILNNKNIQIAKILRKE